MSGVLHPALEAAGQTGGGRESNPPTDPRRPTGFEDWSAQLSLSQESGRLAAGDDALEFRPRLERRYLRRFHLDLLAGTRVRAVRARRARSSKVPKPVARRARPSSPASATSPIIESRMSSTTRCSHPCCRCDGVEPSPLFMVSSSFSRVPN